MPRTFLAALFLAGVPATVFASADSSLLGLAPASSQVVASIDFDGSRNSAFGQFLLRQFSVHDDDLQQLMEQTGFDPRRDIQSLLLTATPPRNPKGPGRFAVLARGNFDQNRIKEAAQKDGSTVQQFQGVDLMVKNHGAQQTAFAFPDVDLAVMGDLPSVRQVIENRSHPANLDPTLQNQISNIEASNAWFASIAPASSVAANVDPNLQKSTSHAQILQSIVQSSGGINLNSDSDVVFNAETRSAQDATALADVIRFMASMMQTQGQKNGQTAPLAAALDSMKLDVTGSSVHMTMHLPEPALEQLAGMQHSQKSARSTR
jgi:hypothetical protein